MNGGYTRELDHRCDHSGCPSTAKLGVYNDANGHMGDVCRRHAARRLAEMRERYAQRMRDREVQP